MIVLVLLENLRELRNFKTTFYQITSSKFAQLKEVTEKYHKVSEINESLRRQNSNLREQIEDQEKEINELYDSKEKLGYFETFLRKEDYDKVIEMGEEQDKIRVRSRYK